MDNFEKQKVIFIGCEDTKKAFKSTGSTSDDQDDGVGTACGGDVSARLAEHCTFFASAMQGEKFLFVLGTLNFFPNLLKFVLQGLPKVYLLMKISNLFIQKNSPN